MKKYQVVFDLANSWENEHIDVDETVVEANNAVEANVVAKNKAKNGDFNDIIKGRKYYIWEVTEADAVE